jgi:hypothetical protein
VWELQEPGAENHHAPQSVRRIARRAAEETGRASPRTCRTVDAGRHPQVRKARKEGTWEPRAPGAGTPPSPGVSASPPPQPFPPAQPPRGARLSPPPLPSQVFLGGLSPIFEHRTPKEPKYLYGKIRTPLFCARQQIPRRIKIEVLRCSATEIKASRHC